MTMDSAWYEDVAGRIRGLVIRLATELTPTECAEVEHFVEHDEFGEALLALVGIIVEEDKSLDPSAYEQIESLAGDMRITDQLPLDLVDHVTDRPKAKERVRAELTRALHRSRRFVFLGAVALALALSACAMGDRVANSGDLVATGGVSVPGGTAVQGLSAESTAARSAAGQGAPMYRLGTLGESRAAQPQFWALEHPSAPGFASRYGIPPRNVANADFVQAGRLRPGAQYITRPAPGYGPNTGGAPEVVVEPGGVEQIAFSYTGPKGWYP